MPVNYIKQLQLFFDRVRKDASITTQHQVMYLHLFFKWNKQLFNPHIKLDREEIMAATRIGSTDTYYNCLKDLSAGGYIIYLSREKKGWVKMLETFVAPVSPVSGTNDNPDSGTSESPDTGQSGDLKENEVPDSGSPIINNKTIVNSVNKTNNANIPSLDEIFTFFELQKFSRDEARIFWEHFERKDWKLEGKAIYNWKGLSITFVTKFRNDKKDNDHDKPPMDYGQS